MVTLEEVLVTSVRLLGGSEGAMGREGKGASQLHTVADPEFVNRGGEAQHRKRICTLNPMQSNFECTMRNMWDTLLTLFHTL